ncbi:MAG: TonB-dependent receptor [Sulfurovum sp.]|nr:TonB-dependent receptor [Sulfurovum sp.]
MKRQYWLIFLILFLLGTAGAYATQLAGKYKGDFQFIANAHTDNNPNNPPVFMGQAVERIQWEWDFDALVANFRFDKGKIYDIDKDGDGNAESKITGYMLTIGVPITVYGPVELTNNGDSTYTGLINFQVFNPIFSHPAATLEITWKITKVNNTLTITTIDGDGNGFPGTVMGSADTSPSWAGFPFPFEPTWDGVARADHSDSNNDGLTDEEAIALNLNPDLNDNDADGISDIIELGANPKEPLDSDSDGVYDVFEPGSDADDASMANGLRFKGRNSNRLEEFISMSLGIEGETLVHQLGSGISLQAPPGIKSAFDKSSGRGIETIPVFQIASTSPIGGKITAKIKFTALLSSEIAELPKKLLLFRVDTNANQEGLENTGKNFYLQAESTWKRIDDYTIEIYLQDAGSLDDDGTKNGIVDVRFALANNYKGDFHIDSNNGSVLGWQFSFSFFIFTVLMIYRLEKKSRRKLMHNAMVCAVCFTYISLSVKVSAEQLPTVEVETTAGDTARTDIEYDLAEVPGGTNLIDLDKKKDSQATLKDVLDFESGIILQEFFGGNDQPRLNIRGSGIQDNPVSRGVQLLYDGLPVNQADGAFIIGLLDPEQSMLISVYRGANGMQFGASTLGGAINFIQRKGSNSDSVLRLQTGSFGAFNSSVSTGGKNENWDYYVIAGHDRGDGFRKHNKGKRSNLMFNIGYKSENFENRTYFHYTDNYFQIPFLLPKDRAVNNPDSVVGESDKPLDNILSVFKRDPWRDTQQYRLSNKSTLRGKDSEQTVGVYIERIDDYFKNPLTHMLTKSDSIGIEYSYKKFIDSEGDMLADTYQFSVSASHGNMPREFYANNRENGQKIHRFGYLDLKASNLALGVQAVKSISDAWQFVASLQWVQNKRDIKDKQTLGLLDSDFSYSALNPKIGLIYHLDEDIRFYANVSLSSEAPTFWQLVINDALPVHDRQSTGINPLRLQNAITVEMGTEGKMDKINWKFSYYYSWIKDELISEIDDDFGINGRTINYAEDTHHQGIELELNSILANDFIVDGDDLSAKIVYNYTDYKFDGGRFDGNDIAGIPKHLIQAELRYNMGNGFAIAPNLKWQPKDTFADHSNATIQDSFVLWGLKLNYTYNKNLYFFASLDNIADEVYQSSYVIHGSAKDDNGDLVPAFIPGAGRHISAGVVYKW